MACSMQRSSTSHCHQQLLIIIIIITITTTIIIIIIPGIEAHTRPASDTIVQRGCIAGASYQRDGDQKTPASKRFHTCHSARRMKSIKRLKLTPQLVFTSQLQRFARRVPPRQQQLLHNCNSFACGSFSPVLPCMAAASLKRQRQEVREVNGEARHGEDGQE